jgi:hypothetical protein
LNPCESLGLSLKPSQKKYGFQISNETYESLLNIQNKHPHFVLPKSVPRNKIRGFHLKELKNDLMV